jgi:hypothetical protein
MGWSRGKESDPPPPYIYSRKLAGNYLSNITPDKYKISMIVFIATQKQVTYQFDQPSSFQT